MTVSAAFGAVAALCGGTWLGWCVAGRPRSHAAGRDLLVCGWIGWYVQAIVVLGLGWSGRVGPLSLGLVLLLPVAAGFVDRRLFGAWLATALADYREALRGPRWLVALAVVATVWCALQLTAPVFHYDLLTYSFGQPAHWLAEGRVGPVGPDMFAYQAVPSRMHYLFALGLFGDRMVGFSLLLWTLSAGLLLARSLRLYIGQRTPWSLLGLIGLCITPAVWDLLLLRKEDLAALWGGAALLLLIVASRDGEPRSARDQVVLGLVAVATFAAKPGVTAGYVAAAVALCWFAAGRRQRLAVAGLLAAVAFAALLPIAIHAGLGLGHPLAPTMPHLGRYDVASTRWHKALDDAYPWQPQPAARVVPYALAEFGRFYDPLRWNFGDNSGLLVLLIAPLALVAARRRALVAVWLAGMGVWFFTFHWPRFALVLLPLTLLLVLDALRRLSRDRLAAGVAVILLFATIHVGFYAGATVTGVKVFRPALIAAFGGDADLAFVPPSVTICKAANDYLDPREHRILFVGETRVYPCHIPFDYWNANFRHPFERVEHGVPPEQSWERHLRERGITHMIYSPEIARRRMEWSPAMHARFEAWLGRRMEPQPIVARDHESTTVLFELRADGNADSPFR